MKYIIHTLMYSTSTIHYFALKYSSNILISIFSPMHFLRYSDIGASTFQVPELLNPTVPRLPYSNYHPFMNVVFQIMHANYLPFLHITYYEDSGNWIIDLKVLRFISHLLNFKYLA